MVSLSRLSIALCHNANVTLVNTETSPSGRSWNAKHNVANVSKHIKAADVERSFKGRLRWVWGELHAVILSSFDTWYLPV